MTIRFTTTSAAKTALEKQAFVDTWTWDDHANECFDEILTNKNGVQTAQSIALINGLEKVLGKGALFVYLVSMTVVQFVAIRLKCYQTSSIMITSSQIRRMF